MRHNMNCWVCDIVGSVFTTVHWTGFYLVGEFAYHMEIANVFSVFKLVLLLLSNSSSPFPVPTFQYPHGLPPTAGSFFFCI